MSTGAGGAKPQLGSLPPVEQGQPVEDQSTSTEASGSTPQEMAEAGCSIAQGALGKRMAKSSQPHKIKLGKTVHATVDEGLL